MKEVRVRYAPSPTGFLHIGNARTALFNYLFAKKNNGKLIIRIEDTDIARNVEGGEESQLKYLHWLGIDWDESVDVGGEFGPYRQSERFDIYKKYAYELLEKGLAYKCYCTPEELEKEREELIASGSDKLHYSRKCLNSEEQDKPYTIRFKVPSDVDYTFDDLVKGNVTFKSEDIGDWVILKENGIATYNFACVIDDHMMKISHVLRGEDHITNTPKQMMVYNALGFEIPTFCHMTLIVNDSGKKLSKRDESILQFISQYQELGYNSEAMFNFISLLGWSPEKNKEIMSIEELIENFDDKRLSKSPAKFDKDKLTFINNRYVKEMSLEDFIESCKPHLINEDINGDEEFYNKLCGLFQDRISYSSEIVDLYYDFIETEFTIEEEASEFIKQEGVMNTIEVFKNKLSELTEFTFDNVKACIKETGKEAGSKGKMLFMPCRISVSGMMHGPDLPKLIELLGKELVIKRISSLLK